MLCIRNAYAARRQQALREARTLCPAARFVCKRDGPGPSSRRATAPGVALRDQHGGVNFACAGSGTTQNK